MDILTAIQSRRSIRAYSSKPVEQDKLELILEAARLSPSAANRQDWKFIVVRDAGLRAKLTEASLGQPFVGEAPVILVACGTNPDSVMSCGQHRYTVDLSIAVAYMILEASSLGLGTCWLGRFDEQMVKDALKIPDAVRVVAMTPLGYPNESPAPRPRKALDAIVCYNRYL